MAVLPCPCRKKISGKVKVVKRGLATGMGAELAAIDDAMNLAEAAAQKAMDRARCAKPCSLAFKPPTFVVRASGSANNFQIVGAAIVEWTVFPVCVKPPKPPKPAGASVPLVPATQTTAYPFTRRIPCGTIVISITHGVPGSVDGGIAFDFQPAAADGCRCERFGWIQHVRQVTGRWRYDNGTDHSMHAHIGAPSDPTQSVQPMEPGDPGWTGNPWYGASSDPNAPDDFAAHPTPQTKIGDKPTDPNLSFVTQLVCVDTGEVLFSWYWGPVPDGSVPLESVPAGPTPPP